MIWTETHARVLSRAFEAVLGRPQEGTIAFARFLTPDVVVQLARDRRFQPAGWSVYRVADENDPDDRTVEADRAVELRETKRETTLLLVDTSRAGAGMDGIYSAAKEVEEAGLFREAVRQVAAQLTRSQSRAARRYAERAIQKARSRGRFSVSRWAEFDFFARAVAEGVHPGALLHLLGLWPVQVDEPADPDADLAMSRKFVDELLGRGTAGRSPVQRIQSLRLLDPTPKQLADLERFVTSAAAKPLLAALGELADLPHLWGNALRLEISAEGVREIELVPWRNRQGRLSKWSGLMEQGDGDPPAFVLDPEAERSGNYSTLEVRWRARPVDLPKGAAEYTVQVVSDLDEEIASRTVRHAARREEKCRFSNDDFAALGDDAVVNARVRVSVLGNDEVEPRETEEFVIRWGEVAAESRTASGKKVRTLSEGVVELADRDDVTILTTRADAYSRDKKGYVLLKTGEGGKRFRVYRPPLIREAEEDWFSRQGHPGRWLVRVRESGVRVGAPEFVPLEPDGGGGSQEWLALWERVVAASRRFADRVAVTQGAVGQIYDDKSQGFGQVVEYLNAWAALLSHKETPPVFALTQTVEVQSLSGRTLGVVVLPAHPLRVAWHVGYDTLVLFTRYVEGASPKSIRDEFKLLDGAMFAPFLPGPAEGRSFVFADTLGFHAVGMVADDDEEPKAALAVLNRALGESDANDTTPTVGQQSAHVLGSEIQKYLECHEPPRVMHVHALRPGDGLTVVRSLGRVQGAGEESPEEGAEPSEGVERSCPAFVLELYPSQGQRGVAGRFLSELRERRRSGAGRIEDLDRWVFDSVSLPGGGVMPKLRWARRDVSVPDRAAHIGVAFDTFQSKVVAGAERRRRPLFAFGLLSFFDRTYTGKPTPQWEGAPNFDTLQYKNAVILRG